MADTELQVKISAKLDELRAGLNQVNSEVSGLGGKIESGMTGANASISKMQSGVSSLGVELLKLVGIYEAIRFASDQFAAGINFNSQMEQSKLGIATLITAQADLKDASGQAISGQEALTQAIRLSDDQMQKLRIAGLQTSATTKQLAEAFQQAVGAGMSAGLNLDQIRQLTVQITQAAGALGVPMNQLNQEVTSILNGTIDMNSRVAKSLGISNSMVENWKKQGTLAQELSKRMESFTVAGAETAKTWEATKSNIEEARDTMMGMITGGFFEKLKEAANSALSGIFDVNNATIGKDLKGFVSFAKTAFDNLGAVIAAAIKGGVQAFKDMSAWIEKNQVLIDNITSIARDLSGLAVDIAENILEWSDKLLKAVPILDTLKSGFNFIATSLARARGTETISQEIDKIEKRIKNFNESGIIMHVSGNLVGFDISEEEKRLDQLYKEREKLNQAELKASTPGNQNALPTYTAKPTGPDTKAEAEAAAKKAAAEAAAKKAADKAVKDEQAKWQAILNEADKASDEMIAVEERGLRLKKEIDNQELKNKRDLSLKEIDIAEQTAREEYNLGIKSNADLLKDEARFSKQRYEIEKKTLLDEQSLLKDDLKAQEKNKNDLLKLEKDYQAKQKQIQMLELKESLSIYKDIFGAIKSAFSQSIQGMIQGTLTLRDAVANIGQAILAHFVQLGVDMLANWVEKQIAMALFEEATRSATTATAIAENVAEAESYAAVGAVAAGASVAAIPVVGWSMVPAVTAETYALLAATGAMASAAGGFDIPAGLNPITQLHEKEMVLPAKHADVIRSLADGGIKSQAPSNSVNVHFNVSAIDAGGVKKFFADNGKHIATAIASQQRAGNNKLRSLA